MPLPTVSQSGAVPQDLDPFQDSMDIKYVGSSYSLDDQADWAVGRSVLFAPNTSKKVPAPTHTVSREEAARYLKKARIALFAYLPYTHPLSWRTKLDGTLVKEESESLACTLGKLTGICNRLPETDSQNGAALDASQVGQENLSTVDESAEDSRGRKRYQQKA